MISSINVELLFNLDLLNEKGEMSQLRLAKYHNRMTWYYNALD